MTNCSTTPCQGLLSTGTRSGKVQIHPDSPLAELGEIFGGEVPILLVDGEPSLWMDDRECYEVDLYGDPEVFRAVIKQVCYGNTEEALRLCDEQHLLVGIPVDWVTSFRAD